MRKWAVIGLVLVGTAGPAAAHMPFSGVGVNVSPTNYPGAPKAVYEDTSSQPYAMNYSEEAAQNLGVQNGHVDVFSAQPAENRSYLPSFSGGLGSDGAMLKLQWHPGE